MNGCGYFVLRKLVSMSSMKIQEQDGANSVPIAFLDIYLTKIFIRLKVVVLRTNSAVKRISSTGTLQMLVS